MVRSVRFNFYLIYLAIELFYFFVFNLLYERKKNLNGTILMLKYNFYKTIICTHRFLNGNQYIIVNIY